MYNLLNMAEAKTIDDIFEQMSHFESRGSNIVVTHPVVRDMTENVLEQKSQFTGSPEIPEGTRYFGFFDPDILDTTYTLASSKTSFHQSKSDEVEQYGIQEQRRSPFDKIGQRQLCDELGIFENPRYLDIRKLFTDSHTRTTFRFVPEEFTDFPLDEIVSGLEQTPRSYIFHNMIDGFRIRNSKKGGYTISGRSELVKETDTETKRIKDPRQRLEAFLGKLTEKGFSLEAIGYKGDTRSQQEDLVSGILSHKGNIYIKDARTGGGYLVTKVRKEGDEVHVESDSPDFARLIESRETVALNRRKSYERLLELNAPEVILDHHRKGIDDYNPKDSVGILYDLFRTLRDPIIEEEVSYETFNGHRAEFRLICQRVPKTKSEDGAFEIEGYAKVSNNGVSANISLGGHGESVRDVLRGMYGQRMPEIPESELSSIVDEAERNVMTRTKDFAEKVYSHYASNSTLNGNGIEAPRDFVVDLIPQWNDENRRIDHCFLEINHQYDYKGLREVDLSAAGRVHRNKALIQENKQDRV